MAEQIYNPFTGNFAAYGQGPEHVFFTQAQPTTSTTPAPGTTTAAPTPAPALLQPPGNDVYSFNPQSPASFGGLQLGMLPSPGNDQGGGWGGGAPGSPNGGPSQGFGGYGGWGIDLGMFGADWGMPDAEAFGSPYAKGGLAKAAEHGRHGDTQLVHMSRSELEELDRLAPGGLTRNPQTGLPEAFKLGKILKSILPIAAAVAAPVLGPALGSALLPSASGLLQGALGAGLIGGGAGAVSGGLKGALTGGLLGAGSSLIAPVAENAFAGAFPETASSVGLSSGNPTIFDASSGLAKAASAGASTTSRGGMPEAEFGMQMPAAAGAAGPRVGSNSQEQSWFQRNWPYLAAGALTVDAAGRPKQQQFKTPQAQIPGSNQPLQVVSMNRTAQPVAMSQKDWYTYGQRPEASFYKDNQLPGLAAGGAVDGPGTGQSDDIPAMLSDGEYVIDANSVAALGDGSTDAGAKKLDEMRNAIARHKGRKQVIEPKAKGALEYMK